MLKKNIEHYFKARRDKVCEILKKEQAVLLLPSSAVTLRNPDVHFAFRQESNFYYLTGFEEPHSFLAIYPTKNGNYESALFGLRRDPEKEIWEGENYGVENFTKIFGVDRAFSIDELEIELPKCSQFARRFYYALGSQEKMDRQVIQLLEKVKRLQGKNASWLPALHHPDEILSELRLIKSTEEMSLLRKACAASATAHLKVMEYVRPGMNESDVEAYLGFQFRSLGCERLGYDSIVASAKNGTCLHYRHNNEILKEGSLLLIDAGGEHQYYTADITRTFPIGSSFTPQQKSLYALVLKAQKAALQAVKPGSNQTKVHNSAVEVLVEGLLELGLLTGKAEEIIRTQQFKRFYPHGTGHWLGMDVHDVGAYQNEGVPRPLQPGMVFTVEPGLYVQPGDKDAPAEFRGIGIRIEDDVLVTESGYENLTQIAPKEIEEIEQLRAKAIK